MSGFDPNGAALPDGGIFGLPSTPDDARAILIPVPWDVTTSYRPGTARGPAAILAASPQIDLYDVDTGRPYRHGIAMLPEDRAVRTGNQIGRPLAERVIAVGGRLHGDAALERARAKVDDLGAELNQWVRDRVADWLDADRLVGVVGGDHSVPFGAIEAMAERFPGMGILHVDAHADLRDAYEGFTWSHASIMFNVVTRLPQVSRVVQVGVRDLCEAEAELIRGSGDRVVTHFDAEIQAAAFRGESWDARCESIVDALPDQVYVSFDIDGLDPALCPHTGTPVPGGLSFGQVNHLLGSVVRSGRRIVGFDLCEVAPGPGGGGDGDDWDANVGMRILYKLIGWALWSP